MDAAELLARLLKADQEYRAAMKEAQSEGSSVVQTARRELGLTQRQLAERLGMHHTYVSKIEGGKAVVSKPFLAKLARLMGGVSVDDGMGRVLVSEWTPAPAHGLGVSQA